ncbi:DnaJ domain-containing protein [Candidatus Nitrosocosmicus sp. FF01]|uniref:ferredoxin n=1 Tax=Candidatus Nitrosocosmicus sp. FF01 TaxID=3397670 RepID=UPI0039E99AB8
MDDNNYYRILEIPENSTQRDIKIAFRRLARKYHPDRNSVVSDEVMKNINIAFENLSDPEKRQIYDESLKVLKSNLTSNVEEFEDSDANSWDLSIAPTDTNEYAENYYDVDTFFFDQKELKNESISTNSETLPTSFLESRYQIIVEPSLCLAFGSCEVLAPKVFVVEKNRQINPKAIVISETAEDFDTIMDAAKTCPTKAIIIIDRYTGNCIYP